MFKKLLIANRGEIACRVIRSAKHLGIHCVAVYSDADEKALHVRMADEAFYLGGSPAQESYLCGEKILHIAQQTGCDAIHPGYGFLSENAGFAHRCEVSGIVFVGPPSSAIESMGSKSIAKTMMEAAGVPLVPGYHGHDQSPDVLKKAAETIGYPVLLKAVAGGGGKGMRRVDHPDDFLFALAAAQREAQSSFKDSSLLIEKYVQNPRHVEIQIFTDHHGNGVYLFERDCSVQRRYQKIIEEAPAPGLDENTRQKMGEVAVTAAKVIGYVGAGTVEFLLDANRDFYFMEMNTRLQVEHPVTEMITGQDLVAWQLHVAFQQPLPLTQKELFITGHAIEVRIYAEDPDNHFLPATGTLAHLRLPQLSEEVRVDTGIVEGDEISIHYDPLIAKLIVWGADRPKALSRMRQALAQYQMVGLKTNLSFLQKILRHDAFCQGGVDTHFIENHRDSLFSTYPYNIHHALMMVALFDVLQRQQEFQKRALATQDPWSPWFLSDAWCLNQSPLHLLSLKDSQQCQWNVTLEPQRNGSFLARIGGEVHHVSGIWCDHQLRVTLDHHTLTVTVVPHQNTLTLFMGSHQILFERLLPDWKDSKDSDLEGNLNAPMNGTVIKVLVAPGQKVQQEEPLMIMESMKMEYTIRALTEGTVQTVFFKEKSL